MDEAWIHTFSVSIVDFALERGITRGVGGFLWRYTPEGVEYWRKIHNGEMTPQAYAILWFMKKRYLEVKGGR